MLKETCSFIETLDLSTCTMMEEFGLAKGHPWEGHASSPSTSYYGCLYNISKSVNPSKILEIGTAFGMSAASLISSCGRLERFISMDLGVFGKHLGFSDNIEFAKTKLHKWAEIHAIDPNRISLFRVNTQPEGSDNNNNPVDCPHWSTIQEPFPSFDILFVDGKHTGWGLYNDIMTFWKYLRSGGLLICDDLHDKSLEWEWSGDTINSYCRANRELSTDIKESYIWNFPRVSTPGIQGLRPFGIFLKS